MILRFLADYVEFYATTALATTQQRDQHAPLALTVFASWVPNLYINLGAS